MNKALPLEVQADDLNFVSNLDNWTDSLGAWLTYKSPCYH
jgi:hypothetical protein